MRSRFLAAVAAAAVLASVLPHPDAIDGARAQGRSDQGGRGGGDAPGRSAESSGRGAERSGGRGLGGAGSETTSAPGSGAPSASDAGSAPGGGSSAPGASPGSSGGASAPSPSSPGSSSPGSSSPGSSSPGSSSPSPASPGSSSPGAPSPDPSPAPSQAQAQAPSPPPSQTDARAPASPGPVAQQPREPATTGALPRASARSADESGGGAALPSALLPRGRARAPVAARPAPLTWTPGTPRTVVTLCWNALVAAAGPYDPVWLDVASAGRMRQEADGALVAPLAARVIYGPERGNVVRLSEVACRLDARGRVVALR